MRKVSLKKLLEAGAHFGHKVTRWDPRMKPYIFEARENIHIIDLVQTKKKLELAGEKARELGKEGKVLLLVGTKRQAAPVIQKLGEEFGIPFIAHKWVGGLITNWEQVKKNIERTNEMAREEKDGSWEELPKHEQLEKKRELEKLRRVYSGVLRLEDVPDALYIVDIKNESTAVREAKRSGVFSIGIADTNVNPNDIDLPIPANDDAVGSIEYITSYIVEAYKDGQSGN